MVCCRNHCPQQSWQISARIRAPIAPGKGGRSNPARVCPQRTHVTSAIVLAGELMAASVVDAGETEELEQADVEPADVELEPTGCKPRRLRICVMVVVQLLASEPDGDRRDVAALVLHGVVAI